MKRDDEGSPIPSELESSQSALNQGIANIPKPSSACLEDCIAAIDTIVKDGYSGCHLQSNGPAISNDGPILCSDDALRHHEREAISGLVRTFDMLSSREQTFLVQVFLTRMSHNQHNGLEVFLRAMLRRDFIRTLNGSGLSHISERILSMLDAHTLFEAEQCSTVWNRTVEQGKLWRRLIDQKLTNNSNWRSLAKRRKWSVLLGHPIDGYREADIKTIQRNWRCGVYSLRKIHCNSANSKGVYCLQYDDEKIVSGLRDNSIKIWNRRDHTVVKTMVGHTGSVLCLQYEDDILVTGSSDTTIRVWSIMTGTSVNMLVHHNEAVLHLRFVGNIMVSSSKDRTIAVWDMKSPTDIVLRRALLGHRAAVNVVDFDSRFIISASGDRTIKMWITESCEYYRTLSGHRRGIACLQYLGDLIVTGSSDNTIRIWNAISGVCLRTLEGHQELVRCIRFNDQYIVSGAYDGKIKVWDLQAALDPLSGLSDFCIRTLTHHTGRVFRLQFDMFQIVSSSHDDTILFFDFCSNHLACRDGRRIAENDMFEASSDARENPPSINRSPSMNPLSSKVRCAIDTVMKSMRPTNQTGEASAAEDIEMEE